MTALIFSPSALSGRGFCCGCCWECCMPAVFFSPRSRASDALSVWFLNLRAAANFACRVCLISGWRRVPQPAAAICPRASSQVTYPPPPPYPSCVRNTFHFIPPLHPSHVLKFISLYLDLSHPTSNPSSWSAHFPSLPSRLSPPRCSPGWVTVSSHSINQACEGSCVQCSIASHSPRLLPSVPVSLPSLSQSLWGGKKKLALPDTVCSPSSLDHPTTITTTRSGDGQDAAGVPDSPHLIWLDNQPRNGQDLLSPLLRHNIDLKARDRMGGGKRDTDKMAQTRCCMTRVDLISLPTCR